MQSTILREKRSNTDLGIISELIKLMKPRVMSLVIFTCAVGLLTAPNSIPFTQAAIGILIVAIGAGAAGALNGKALMVCQVFHPMDSPCLGPVTKRTQESLSSF